MRHGAARAMWVSGVLVAAACSTSGHASSHRVATPTSQSTPTTRPGSTVATTGASTGASTTKGPTSSVVGPGTTGSSAPTAPASDQWTTYHRTNDRAGVAVGGRRPTSLTPGWTAGVDGAVYGQPLVVNGSVIAATENDTVYSFAEGSGALQWQRHLAEPVPGSRLPCGDIDPLGVTSTPVYDPTTGSVFVLTESAGGVHTLVALDLKTGGQRFARNLDVGGHDPLAEQQRGALAVANGRVYVPFGGLYGDCGDYVGYVAAVRADGVGPVAHYAVPTAREGGIWAPSGPAIAADGTVYASVGNGASTGGAYDGSDSVIRLSPDLSTRLDYFAPTDWAAANATDRDLGSTGPVLLPNGRVVIAGKGGVIYLLAESHLGGIGGQLASTSGCTAFGGMAADQGAVFVPCTSGLERVDVDPAGLRGRWRAPATIAGSPVVSGGTVWALDTSAGVLYALDESTGSQVAKIGVGGVTRFASPTVAGGRVFIGTQGTVVAVTAQ